MVVQLEKNGVLKECKTGFSFTTLLFGVFVPLFRGDLKYALIMFVLAFLTFGISWIVFPFIYNKIYIKKLLEDGYAPYSDADREELEKREIIAPKPEAVQEQEEQE